MFYNSYMQKLKCDRHLGIRLTSEDNEVLIALARKARVSKSRYCRDLLRKAMMQQIRKDSKS